VLLVVRRGGLIRGGKNILPRVRLLSEDREVKRILFILLSKNNQKERILFS